MMEGLYLHLSARLCVVKTLLFLAMERKQEVFVL
jgi:hypothetical protein